MNEIVKEIIWAIKAVSFVIMGIVILYLFLILGGSLAHWVKDIFMFGWNLLG